MSDVVRLSKALADRYRVGRELGAGGMATVYLAHDLKHDRDVAIKVLKPELGAMLGVERFLSEIKLTANLQHPNLLPLFDSGDADGVLYYVMPYVEGETLRQRLQREKQLPLDETVRLVTLVAGALDFAHARGVVHRDLKPENILLQAGQPVVADFGIALAVSNAADARLTQTGLSLGTPSYMSPEQAVGENSIDARTDQYALGALTYEMLTGEPPYTGPTAQAVIARLLTETPRSIQKVRPGIPEAVDNSVQLALSKAPADRFSSCGEFVRSLRAGAVTGVGVDDKTVRGHSQSLPRSKKISGVMWGAVAAVIAAVALGAWWTTRARTAGLVIGRSEVLTTDDALQIQPAISPDGKLVAYSAGNYARMRIYIRPLAGGRTIPLSDDSASVETNPQWSPDGNSLSYLTRGGVSVAPALGGSSRPVVAPKPGDGVTSAAWSPDGRELAYSYGDTLNVITLGDGSIRFVANVPAVHSCAWSPSGAWIACASGNADGQALGSSFGNTAPNGIIVVPSAGGVVVSVAGRSNANQSPVWSPDSRQLYFISNRDGTRDIYVQHISSSGRARGTPTRLTTGLGALTISLSKDQKQLAYASFAARANIWTLPVSPTVSVSAETATQLTTGNQVIEAMRLSRDGKWLMYDSNLRGNSDIFRIPALGGDAQQLTAEPFDEFAADLSSDGRTIAYHTWRNGTRDIEIKNIDGGQAEQVTTSLAQESYPLWSPDGRSILYVDQREPFRLLVARRDGAGKWTLPHRELASSAANADWSPDGAFIAYVADNRGEPGAIRIVSPAGGRSEEIFSPAAGERGADNVQWGSDGTTLYFKTHAVAGRTSFWSVPVKGGKPREIAHFPNRNRQSSRGDFAIYAQRLYFTIEERQSDVFVAGVSAR